ncbi:MAG: M15 family metallopeptidase [Clostridia bacterium]|nr:M15 family metallopeptidase [Clostridia bacterium]
MRIKKKYRLLCAVLALLTVLVAVGLFWYRADWRFRFYNSIRFYPAPVMTPMAWEKGGISLEELSARGVDSNDLLMLINPDYALPKDFVPLLEEYNGAKMHPQMVEAYAALRDALEERTGQRIYVSSDYRTPEEQSAILAGSQPGIAATVGHSEHEAGLALDVYVKGYGGMSILKTAAGREMARICADYGFIIRYPEGKTEITGTAYEPWHLRYVGNPHATIIMDAGLTLEEYLELYEIGVWYDLGEAYAGRFSPNAIPMPGGTWSGGSLSSDNTGYLFITLKKA